jgi:hypothetical protein
MLLAPPAALRAADTNPYFGLSSLGSRPTGFFRLAKTGERHHLVTPDGRAYLALGINHLEALQQPVENGLRVRGDAAWRSFWSGTLRPQFVDRNLTTLGYGAPWPLRVEAPWFAAIPVAAIEKHRSDPKRDSPLYPSGTRFPEAEMDLLHAVTGKPVLICDHAISFPTAEHPRTIFEQMPDEDAAARATADFLQAAFAKPYMLGYLRCQYIDRPANYGRGLRQGILQNDGTPRDALVRVYRQGFAAALERLKEPSPRR